MASSDDVDIHTKADTNHKMAYAKCDDDNTINTNNKADRNHNIASSNHYNNSNNDYNFAAAKCDDDTDNTIDNKKQENASMYSACYLQPKILSKKKVGVKFPSSDCLASSKVCAK
jgi:hypothetical protein